MPSAGAASSAAAAPGESIVRTGKKGQLGGVEASGLEAGLAAEAVGTALMCGGVACQSGRECCLLAAGAVCVARISALPILSCAERCGASLVRVAPSGFHR